jgi:hypothetical protein
MRRPWAADQLCLLLAIGFCLHLQLSLAILCMEQIGFVLVKTYIDKWRMSVV